MPTRIESMIGALDLEVEAMVSDTPKHSISVRDPLPALARGLQHVFSLRLGCQFGGRELPRCRHGLP